MIDKLSSHIYLTTCVVTRDYIENVTHLDEHISKIRNILSH